jgi:predicted nuclease with TOPRIM domain
MKIQEYRERIWALERENAALRERIVRLQAEVEGAAGEVEGFADGVKRETGGGEC